MSETPYPTNGSGKNLAENTGIKCIFLCTQACPYRLAGLALPPRTGEQLTTKEERIHVFLYNSNKKNNEMTHIKKSSPDTGKVAALAVGRGKLEQTRKNE